MRIFNATKMNLLKNVTDCVTLEGFFPSDIHTKVRHTCKVTQNSQLFFLDVTLGQTNIKKKSKSFAYNNHSVFSET